MSLAKLPPCVITNTSDFKQTKKSSAARLVTCFLKLSISSLLASSSFVTCYESLKPQINATESKNICTSDVIVGMFSLA